MHRVCKNRHIDLIKLLIEIGGDCTILNGTGKTPLDYLDKSTRKVLEVFIEEWKKSDKFSRNYSYIHGTWILKEEKIL